MRTHLFVLVLIHPMLCILTNHSTYICFNGSNQYNISSIDIKNESIGLIGINSSTSAPAILSSTDNAAINIADIINLNININSYKIRSINTNNGNINDIYVLFSPSSLIIYSYKFSYSYNLSLSAIHDACFGNNKNEIFVLTEYTILVAPLFSQFALNYYTNGALTNSINLFMSFLTLPSLFDKMFYENGNVYISFSDRVYLCIANSTLISCLNFTYANTSIDNIDLAAKDNYLYFISNNNFTVIFANNLTLYWSKIFVESLISLTVVECYVFIVSSFEIYQLDYEIQEIIFTTFYNNSLTFLIEYFEAINKLILFQSEKNVNTNLEIFSFTNYYFNMSGNECYNTYGFCEINNACIKNYVKEKVEELSMTTQIINNLNTTVMTETSKVVGKIMALASVRIYPTFLLSFTGFMDDLWFYKYHRTNYPLPVLFFLQEVNIMNQLRLSPWFLDFINWINSPLACNQENAQLYSYLSFNNTDPTNVYFLHSAEDTYKSNLIMNILFLSFLKGLFLLLKFIHKKLNRKQLSNISINDNETPKIVTKGEFFKVIYHKNPEIPKFKLLKSLVEILENNSRWWLIFNAVLEINMLKLTFDCFIQLLDPSYFQAIDKINIFFTLLFLLMLLLYSLCYYPLVYSFNSKPSSEVLLTKTKFSLKSFIFESIYIVSRNFVRSFIHAAFISNYILQISLLTLTDLFYLILGFLMWRSFKNKLVAFCSISYSFALFIFDLFFMLENLTYPEAIDTQNEEDISFILIVALATLSLLLCLILLMILFKQIITSNKVTNKINNNFVFKEENIKLKSNFTNELELDEKYFSIQQLSKHFNENLDSNINIKLKDKLSKENIEKEKTKQKEYLKVKNSPNNQKEFALMNEKENLFTKNYSKIEKTK